MPESPERETMEMDVLLVGAGPANLACAIRLKQLVEEHNKHHPDEQLAPEIYLIEKAAEIGHHQMSGAVLDPRAIKRLIPDWLDKGAPVEAQCGEANQDGFFMLKEGVEKLKPVFAPSYLHNRGNYVISLQKFAAWLGKQAESMGINIFPGFAGAEILYSADGTKVEGVTTRDMGVSRWGERKGEFQPGMDLRAKVTVLGEGTRGSLAKHLIPKLKLDEGRNPQIYQLGCKEVWKLSDEGRAMLKPGDVLHTMGWPLDPMKVFGGGWVYGMADGKASIGLVMGLDYSDPAFDPHAAFQKWKTHPWIAKLLKGGELLHYGAKTIPDGGYFSMPELTHDGVMLVGDTAGFLNGMRLKGVHLAMESGIMAAEAIFSCIKLQDFSKQSLHRYRNIFETSDAKKELWKVRNFRQGFTRGKLFGMANVAFGFVTGGMSLLGNRMSVPHIDGHSYEKLATPGTTPPTPKNRFDDKLTFDKLKDVYFSGTSHEEDQPCHLQVTDPDICVTKCYTEYGNPCQHFCPANVYEIVPKEQAVGASPQLDKEGKGKTTERGAVLKINASNCVHCKTCDIKDPYQVINWVVPEGGQGPVYSDC
ncbi:MAG: electron transfer flavoprotein-ubiquinone oxidoreductase [Planctomycetes bacterium]|nr:electron transfer flavoprotein-ubiquinone oxidoreductase [Planctomycetota bacterium]NUQ33844.1 electron transfer flavoprotein-ubiquinone oxidoreductase [Planctomycetaceae bacterium]